MKHAKPGRLAEFLSGKGFYITLILCAAAIGVSGYILFFGNNRAALEDEDVFSAMSRSSAESAAVYASDAREEPILVDIPDYAMRETEVVMADEYAAASAEAQIAAHAEASDAPEGSETSKSSADREVHTAPLIGEAAAVSAHAEITPPAVSDEAPADIEPETQEVVAPFFVWPLAGEVLNPFSSDELVFNPTTDDWRVHTGIDIAAQSGTHVGAVGDGIVEDVYEDELMGWSVVINHGNGLRSVSRGLIPDIPVSVGDTVHAGTVIGGVGSSAELESAMPSHLHLEFIGDGAQLDPFEILP